MPGGVRLGKQRRDDALQFRGRAGGEDVAVTVDEFPMPFRRGVGGKRGAVGADRQRADVSGSPFQVDDAEGAARPSAGHLSDFGTDAR